MTDENGLKFLAEATEHFGNKLESLQKVIASRSLFSLLGFAFSNIGFIWKHRKEIRSFKSEIIEQVLMGTEPQFKNTRNTIIDNLMAKGDAKMRTLSLIVGGLTKFLNAWFIPTKLIMKKIPESYTTFLSSDKSPAIVKAAKPDLVKKLFDRLAQNNACGKEVKKDAELMRGDALKKFFNKDKLINNGKKVTELEVMGSIIGALASYVKGDNPVLKKFLEEFIKEKMKNPNEFAELITAFKTRATVDYSPENILKRREEAQIALFELIEGLADIGDDLKKPLKDYMSSSKGRENFTRLLNEALTMVLTHDKKAAGGEEVFNSGMTGEEGSKIVRALSDVIVQNLVTDNIVAGNFIRFALKLMQSQTLEAQEIKTTLSSANKLALSENSHGKETLIHTIDAIMPLLKASPIVARALSRIAPGGNISSFMDHFKPVLSSILASGHLDDPHITKIVNAILTPPRKDEPAMTPNEMLSELTAFTAKHPELDLTVGQSLREFTTSGAIPQLVGHAAGNIISDIITATASHQRNKDKQKTSGGSTLSDASFVSLSTNSTNLADDNLPEELADEHHERPRDHINESAHTGYGKEEDIQEAEIGQITKLATDIVAPFVANSGRIYTALGEFNKTATMLNTLQKSPDDTPGRQGFEPELKAEYKEKLKTLMHAILSKDNLAGLTKLEISDSIQDTLATFTSMWVTSDPKRAKLLAGFAIDEDQIIQGVKLLLPIAIEAAKHSAQSMDDILQLADKIIDLDTDHPLDKLLPAIAQIMSDFTALATSFTAKPEISDNLIELFNTFKSSIAKLIDQQLESQLRTSKLIKGEDIVKIIESDISADNIAQVSEIIANLNDFIQKNNQLVSKEFKSSTPQEQQRQITDKNEAFKALIASLFEFSGLAHKIISKLDPEALSTLITHQLTTKPIKAMTPEEVSQLIIDNLEAQEDLVIAIEEIAQTVKDRLMNGKDESEIEGDEFNFDNLKTLVVKKPGSQIALEEIFSTVNDQLLLAKEGAVDKFDMEKVQKLADLGLSPETLKDSLPEFLALVIDLVKHSLSEDSKEDIKLILCNLIEIKSEKDFKSILTKLSETFDLLKAIADKNADFRRIIDTKLKAIITKKGSLFQPLIESIIFNQVQEPLAKGLKMSERLTGQKLSHAGNEVLNRAGNKALNLASSIVSHRAGQNISLDYLQSVFQSLKQGGPKGYGRALWSIIKQNLGLGSARQKAPTASDREVIEVTQAPSTKKGTSTSSRKERIDPGSDLDVPASHKKNPHLKVTRNAKAPPLPRGLKT